jgi:hypothetical protein
MKKAFWLTIVSLFAGAATIPAQETMQTLLSSRSKKFVFVFGGASVRFDSSFKFLDKETGNSVFIDPEGQLGLQERQEVPSGSFLVSLKDKHFLSIGFTSFERDSRLLDAESTTYGDLEVESGTIDVWLDSNDFDLSYAYKLFADDHIRILGKAGIYTLDLDAGIRAEGEWSIEDEPDSGVYERSRSLIAPLPLLGVLFNFYIDNRWALAISVEAMYLPVGDITGRALRSKINARYAFGKAVGITFGINYFDVDVTDDGETRRYDIKYGYDGLFAGLIFAF